MSATLSHSTRYLPRLATSLVLVGLGCFTLVGCSGKGDINGTVAFKGAPLTGGTVTLASTSGGPSFSSAINEDGTFTINGARTGAYKVCVETESLKPAPKGGASDYAKGAKGPPAMGGKSAKGSMPPGVGGRDLAKDAISGKISNKPPAESNMPTDGSYRDGFATIKDNAKRYIQIPLPYSKPESTDLTFEVKNGVQVFNIELQEK